MITYVNTFASLCALFTIIAQSGIAIMHLRPITFEKLEWPMVFMQVLANICSVVWVLALFFSIPDLFK